EVPVFAEIDLGLAEFIALRRSDPTLLTRYREAVAGYGRQVRSHRTIIERGARVCHIPQLRNSYVGPYSIIHSAANVSECTLLSSSDEPVVIESGACISESILQWGVRVRTQALVERSVLTEHSSVERQGKVFGSLLGP